MEKRLLELLNQIFSPKEEPQNLSEEEKQQLEKEKREMQKELISIAYSIYANLKIDFGNADTGEMNVSNLTSLHQKLQHLRTLYEKVFTFDGEIRSCGRNKCIELMEAASELYPDVYFGNTKTGIMNPLKLLEYRDSIFA